MSGRFIDVPAQGRTLSDDCRRALDFCDRRDELDSSSSSEAAATSSVQIEDFEWVRRHYASCSGCRHAALAHDPMWAFRLLENSSNRAAATVEGPRGHTAGSRCGGAELEDLWDIDDLKQRVHGTIRARKVEDQVQRSASSSWHRSAGLAAAVVLVLMAGLLQGGRSETTEEDDARLRVVSFLETLPVVDAGVWEADRLRETFDASGRELQVNNPDSGEERAEILAQMSGVVADLVWIVDGSLEI